MASNKNQHFVPRCYLKPFTLNGEGAAIHLYNIDRGQLFENAPVKNQCSGDYFYGQNAQLERAIQATEGGYARVSAEVFKPGFRLSDGTRQLLRIFWLLQFMRTEAAAQRSAQMSAAMLSMAGPEAASFRLQIKDAVQIAMLTFADQMHVVDDLKVCLLRNRTDIPFVTSDDPAVLTNRWHLENRHRAYQSFGLGKAGALMLLPLSPSVLLLGYDGDVYSVPHENGWASVCRDADVDALNEHQFLNCRANVFVGDLAHSKYVQDAYSRASGRRLSARHVLHYAVLESTDETHKRYAVVDGPNPDDPREGFIHLQTRYPLPSKWPLVLNWRANGKAYTNGTGRGYVRLAGIPSDASPPYRQVRTP